METLAHKETTTHPSSHVEDEACEGGWSGYPSDHQTTLDKLHVGLSDKRDRADELYESETSGPVSGRTRKRIQKKKREASRLSNRNDDDRPGHSGEDATNGNVQKYVTNDKPTNCRYLGSDHSTSTVKYICQTGALLW